MCICSLLIISFILLLTFLSCSQQNYSDTNNLHRQDEEQVYHPISSNMEHLPFFIDAVDLNILSISESTVQLQIKNNSEIRFYFHDCVVVRDYLLRLGEMDRFALEYFDGTYWRTITPYIPYSPYDIILSFFQWPIQPHEYIIMEYTLTYHDIPKTEAGLYRIRLTIFIMECASIPEMRQQLREFYEAGGEISHYNANIRRMPRHTLTAEFYWDGETFTVRTLS